MDKFFKESMSWAFKCPLRSSQGETRSWNVGHCSSSLIKGLEVRYEKRWVYRDDCSLSLLTAERVALRKLEVEKKLNF